MVAPSAGAQGQAAPQASRKRKAAGPPEGSPKEKQAAADPGSKIKGRPKRDPNVATATLCTELGEVTSEGQTFAAWFGAKWAAANRRSIKRIVDDLQAGCTKTQCKNECLKLITQKKRLDCVLATLDFIHKHGIDHEGLCDVMAKQDHFLAMEPVAVVVWPAHLRLHRNLHSIRKCSEPKDF